MLDANSIFTLLASFGLSLSAGGRAYLPLLALGIASDIPPIGTFHIRLLPEFNWLGNGFVIAIFGLLTLYEISADKIPVVDHINDIIHTAIRPLSGAVLFIATDNPLTHAAGLTSGGSGLSLTPGLVIAGILGAGIAGTTHIAKSGTRAASTVTTAGLGNPVLSIIEDVLAIVTVLFALIAPVIGAIFFALLVFLVVRGIALFLRRRRQRQAQTSLATTTPAWPQ